MLINIMGILIILFFLFLSIRNAKKNNKADIDYKYLSSEDIDKQNEVDVEIEKGKSYRGGQNTPHH